MIRIATVFWASCAPMLMVTIAPHQVDPSLPIGPSTLVGIAGATYAGCVGAFAALKKRKLGVVIQGMAVGSAGTIFVEAFVMGYINKGLEPETVEYLLPWIQLALRLCCGGIVVKLFLKFADARDMGSTVVSGAVSALQIFCSFGFSFTQSLGIGSIMSGDFGCTSAGCYYTLVFFVLFAALGAFSQMKQFAVEQAQEAGTFEPKGKFDKISAYMNDKLKILLEVNQTVLDASEDHTPEELAELAKRHTLVVMQCLRVFSCLICLMSGLSVTFEMLELLVLSGLPPGFLVWVTALVTLCGVMTSMAGVYGFQAMRVPADEGKRKDNLMERALYLCVFVIPLAIILMIVFATTIHSKFVRAYLDLEGLENGLEGLPGADEVASDVAGLYSDDRNLTDAEIANMTALEGQALESETVTLSDLLALLTVSLVYLVLSLCFGIYTLSKALGGWIYVAIKVSSFAAYVVWIYGFLVATAGYHFDSAEYMATVKDARKGKFDVTPYSMLAAIGLFMMFQSSVGLLGLKIGPKGKCLVKFYTLTLYLTLIANAFCLLMGASLALQTESTGRFVLVKDQDFDPAQCYVDPTQRRFLQDTPLSEANNDGDTALEPVVTCPDEFRGQPFSELSSDAAQALCEEAEGCAFMKPGRLHGKFGRGMNTEEMIELIRESWRVLAVIGLVIIGILLIAVMGGKYVGRNIGTGPGQQSAEEALETSKAEAIEKDNEKAKQIVANAHKSTCPTCGGTGRVQDEESDKILEQVDAHIDKAENKELQQAGVDVEKRTEIKRTKKEQKRADALAKKAALAEAKAEKARIKQEKKAAKAAAKLDAKAQKKQKSASAPPPLIGDDGPAQPAAADPDLESLEQLEVGDLNTNPMVATAEDLASEASKGDTASSTGHSGSDDQFEMEGTILTTLGEEKPMTKKEKKAAEKAAKKAEKEAQKAKKKKQKDKDKGKVMEAEFDSPKPTADDTADNPVADAALE